MVFLNIRTCNTVYVFYIRPVHIDIKMANMQTRMYLLFAACLVWRFKYVVF